MKFYYNDKLVRTSANHHYTHAVINQAGKCIGCRTSLKDAQYIIDYEINQATLGIENAQAAIKALNAGKSYYICRYGRRTYPVSFTAKNTVKGYEGWIADNNAYIDRIRNSWHVVELEER